MKKKTCSPITCRYRGRRGRGEDWGKPAKIGSAGSGRRGKKRFVNGPKFRGQRISRGEKISKIYRMGVFGQAAWEKAELMLGKEKEKSEKGWQKGPARSLAPSG